MPSRSTSEPPRSALFRSPAGLKSKKAGLRAASASAALPLWSAALAVGAVSAGTLAYEVLLTRLFSLVFQYHYAFMAVSLAVFGLGVGALLAYLTGVTAAERSLAPLSLSIGMALPISAFLFSRLAAYDLDVITILVALAPFVIAGMFLAVLYSQHSVRAAPLYAADLAGAVLGLALSVGLVGLLGAFNAIFLAGGLAAVAALALSRRRLEWLLPAGLIVLLVALTTANLSTRWVELPTRNDSAPPDKVMYNVLANPAQKARLVDTIWSAFARVDLVETADPDQSFIFTDGGAGSFMLRFDGDLSQVAWLAQQPGFLPFAAGPLEQVLILGAGAGKDILQAKLAGSQEITAVEINPAMVELTRRYAAYNGGILDSAGVQTVVTDGRNFIERSLDHYDLLYLNLVYAQANQPGSAALSESYIFTVEAFQAYWQRLSDEGRIAIVSHQALEGSRALITALDALQREGLPTSEGLRRAILLMLPSEDPNQRLTVLILRRSPWTLAEVDELLGQASFLGLQPLFAPGRFEQTFAGLVDDQITIQQFLTDPAYDLSPTTDERPFFFNLKPGLPAPLVTLMLVATAGLLVYSALVSLSRSSPSPSQLVYFLLPGLGFMLLEMPLIQRFILLLGNPTLSMALVLGALLLGAGLGSLSSRTWKLEVLRPRVMQAALVVCALALLLAWIQPSLVRLLLSASLWVRSLAAGLLVFLVGLPLGVPFSSGLRLLGHVVPGKTALLWGWNAIASVVGSALATLLAMLFGFGWALAAGALCYLALAGLLFWLERSGRPW